MNEPLKCFISFFFLNNKIFSMIDML